MTRTDRNDVHTDRRHRGWLRVAGAVVAYAVGGVLASLIGVEYLDDLTLLAYAVAEVGGAAFLIRYWPTDWRTHPWGRHVMAFMVCMEVIFTLSLSRRLFGDWPGLQEALFLASVTFAGIVWWRYRLLAGGPRPPRGGGSPTDRPTT